MVLVMMILRTEFYSKVITDLGITFSATEKLTFSFSRCILNILPEWRFKAMKTVAATTISLMLPLVFKISTTLLRSTVDMTILPMVLTLVN
jgi:iron complex outermembrane receptor protein